MWNKRKEDEFAPKPAPMPPPSPAESVKEAKPMSTPLPGRLPVAEPHNEAATIGKSVVVKGQIISREDLFVDGELEGTVEAQEHRLTIGPNGKLKANVKAREVVVLGSVHGNIDAIDRIDIRRDAQLVGDIRTARIMIEDGAYFKGSVDITRGETGKPAAVRPLQQAAPASAGNAAPPLVTSAPEAKR